VTGRVFRSLWESEMVMEILPLKCVDLKWIEPLPHIVVNAGTDDMIFYLMFHKSTNKNKVGYRTYQE
jgi:hypothetical protein